MKIQRSRMSATAAMIGACVLTLSACGSNDSGNASASQSTSSSAAADDTTSTEADGDGANSQYAGLSGTLNGSGASSQGKAMQAWRDNFSQLSDVQVNYTETGSGTGRSQFIDGQVSFIGTDAALTPEEMTAASERCSGAGVIELPTYVSPIAVAFNLPGIAQVNMTAENIADIFSGKITTWNDPQLSEHNPDIALPATDIIIVHRADKSGTTENFTDYLHAAVPQAWPTEGAQVWPDFPSVLSQSAEGTSGVVSLVTSTEGAITYADASQIGDLGSVAVRIGEDFVAYSAEAAAKIVDGSPKASDASDTVMTVDLKRDGSIAGAYPIVLISYHVGCLHYEDASEAANVRGFLTYIASVEGQAAAAEAAGTAPISDELRERVNAAIAKISSQ